MPVKCVANTDWNRCLSKGYPCPGRIRTDSSAQGGQYQGPPDRSRALGMQGSGYRRSQHHAPAAVGTRGSLLTGPPGVPHQLPSLHLPRWGPSVGPQETHAPFSLHNSTWPGSFCSSESPARQGWGLALSPLQRGSALWSGSSKTFSVLRCKRKDGTPINLLNKSSISFFSCKLLTFSFILWRWVSSESQTGLGITYTARRAHRPPSGCSITETLLSFGASAETRRKGCLISGYSVVAKCIWCVVEKQVQTQIKAHRLQNWWGPVFIPLGGLSPQTTGVQCLTGSLANISPSHCPPQWHQSPVHKHLYT